jgi:hypothetical protein
MASIHELISSSSVLAKECPELEKTGFVSSVMSCTLPVVKGSEENRGKHWKAKISEGNSPEPWKYTKEWAEKRSKLEAKFSELVGSEQCIKVLPWRRASPAHRTVGNTNKVLFIELVTHHMTKSAFLTFFDDERMGFLGIKGIFVCAENRPAFDAGLIPSVDSKRQTATLAQIKTLIKIWHTAGFVERVLEGGALSYAFDQATFDRMRAQAQRAEGKRRAAKPSSDNSEIILPTQSQLFASLEAVTSSSSNNSAGDGGVQPCAPEPARTVTGAAQSLSSGIEALLMAAQARNMADLSRATEPHRAPDCKSAGRACPAKRIAETTGGYSDSPVHGSGSGRHFIARDWPRSVDFQQEPDTLKIMHGSAVSTRLASAEVAAAGAMTKARVAEAKAVTAEAHAAVAVAEARTLAAEARAAAAEARAAAAELRVTVLEAGTRTGIAGAHMTSS